MINEIKFKGRRKDNFDLVYGCYLFDNSYGYARSNHLIFPFDKIAELSTMLFAPANGDIKRFTGKCYEVIPETVKQFIGEKDKNGKDIYVSDTVKYFNSDGNDYAIHKVMWDRYKMGYVLSQEGLEERDNGCWMRDWDPQRTEIIDDISISGKNEEQNN
jgi:hypothetical protein